MAKIKTTFIKASMPDARNDITGRYFKYYFFKTFIDNKGNKTFYLNGEETTRDDGNAVYFKIKEQGEDIEREDSIEEVTYEELIERLLKGYDQYVEYIDDYKQYQSACKANKEIMNKVNRLRELIDAEKAC